MYANSPHQMMQAPSFNRSFDNAASFPPPQPQMEKPQIYTVRLPTQSASNVPN